ncbi:PREDICTED: uncharacterized protein LOC109589762 [Amphimedon queenslandica]|uniref:Uncharacterized protein n=1 Tax=Amphimedon queenslandica TaxID=400682 RepID=A0AAN0JWP4_AMPQE|nr:PREDICTED: uncharacterized protein LOC109589762 [Amphimedon queenslandica]|eukprot:XP_019861343.1 PREDICTED: uncharacterized protein LOC109589762 [Amphimedon queenslandica]
MFSVNSYNYLGQIVGNPLKASVCVSTPTVNVEIFPDYDNDHILIIIIDTSICRVDDTSCSISLTDSSSYNEMMPCALGKVVEFTNITFGKNYTYSVTVANLFGSSNSTDTVG